MLRRIVVLFLLGIALVTCRKDVDVINTDPSARLIFSDNVVLFDTIFATVGSTTHRLRVYNPGNEAVRLSSISIRGLNGTAAYFRMNVDGIAGNQVTNIEIGGKDSLFVFIDVTINPNDEKMPFLIEGEIEFVLNGNIQKVPVLAYGRNAHFILPNVFPSNLPPYRIVAGGINGDTTWTKDLPIVIYGYAVVDSTQTLTIEAGTEVYLHANAGIWVYRYGQIIVDGTVEDHVTFQGDRLDDYKGIAGSWDRIWINEGQAPRHNIIKNAEIKDAFIGIQAEYNPFLGRKDGVSENVLFLENVIVDNCKANGIYGLNYLIRGDNVAVTNCGSSNFYATGSGVYEFRFCTFSNYWRGKPRNDPAVFLTNFYFDFEARVFVEDSMIVNFDHCIIYGDQESEFNIEDEIDPGDNINFNMRYTLLKTDIDTLKYGKYEESIINPSNTTIFIDPVGGDVRLAPDSPAIGAGNPGMSNPPDDITGKPRALPPDLGAYDF